MHEFSSETFAWQVVASEGGIVELYLPDFARITLQAQRDGALYAGYAPANSPRKGDVIPSKALKDFSERLCGSGGDGELSAVVREFLKAYRAGEPVSAYVERLSSLAEER